jgi:hypothetical protein
MLSLKLAPTCVAGAPATLTFKEAQAQRENNNPNSA